MVLQKPDSKYQDLKVSATSIPPTFLMQKKSVRETVSYLHAAKIIEKDRRIFGIGRIDNIDSYSRKAILQGELWLVSRFSTPYTFMRLGRSEKNPNTQQSMSPISESEKPRLLAILLEEIADDEEVVEQEGRMNVEIHQSPLAKSPLGQQRTKSESIRRMAEEAMSRKSMNASQIARWLIVILERLEILFLGKIKLISIR